MPGFGRCVRCLLIALKVNGTRTCHSLWNELWLRPLAFNLQTSWQAKMLFIPQRPSALHIKIIVGSVFLFSTLFLVFRSTSASQLGNLRLKKPSRRALVGDVFNSTLGVSLLSCWCCRWQLTRVQFEKIFAINLPARTDHRDALLLASTLTNIKIDLIDGVKGDAVLDKVLPPQARGGKFATANVGSWRAHMNAIAAYVDCFLHV